MQDSRLIEIFQQLHKKELRELGKFVRSPFHNQRKDVVRLYEYLVEWLRKGKKENLSKEITFPVIFPKEKYDEKKIRYTMSFLYQAIKSFLAYQEFTAHPIQEQTAVVKVFRKKGLSRLFKQELRIAQTMIAKQPIRNQQYHLQNYQLQQERYRFTQQETRTEALGLEELSSELDQFYIASKLSQSANALTHQALHQSNFKPDFLPEILNYLNQKDFSHNPAIAIYFHCLKILTEEESLPYFKKLRILMEQYSSAFPPRELQDIYTFALNYCIKRLNARNDLFHREALLLYQEGLEKEVFLENGVLSRFNYKNIVALGLGLGDLPWVEQFIEAYKAYLDKKYRESTYRFNLAMLHYKKGNYDEAMLLLQKVGTSDTFNNLNARRMLVRIYYAQGAEEALYSLLDSFQNYIYRKKELGYHRALYLNFVKFTRRLLQLNRYDQEQVTQLREEIEETTIVAEKVWLLEQLIDIK